jgi:hypothetical protein
MFYRDRLNDDYENHQRDFACFKDELDVLAVDLKVKRQSWYESVLVRLGDALISIGNSMKEHNKGMEASTLSPLARCRNETVSQ